MAKLNIQLLGKNGTLIGEVITINSDYIPRAGEIIDSGFHSNLETNNFYIITGVIHKLINNEFEAHIRAKEWYQGYRNDLLKDYGWLEGEQVCYDETEY